MSNTMEALERDWPMGMDVILGPATMSCCTLCDQDVLAFRVRHYSSHRLDPYESSRLAEHRTPGCRDYCAGGEGRIERSQRLFYWNRQNPSVRLEDDGCFCASSYCAPCKAATAATP